jgi:NAD+ synthase
MAIDERTLVTNATDMKDASPVIEAPPAELAINVALARRICVDFIRAQMRQAGFGKLVLGLSGGIDSALVAYLAAEAIGPENLTCIKMPYASSSSSSLTDAQAVVDDLGCESELIEISSMVDGYLGHDGNPGAGGPDALTASRNRRGNIMARTRMLVLYDRSAALGALVIGTGNKTEILLGYTTHFGDDACAFDPIGDLYKTQVRQLSAEVGVPASILAKPPSADLWPGQTDESELHMDYATLDRILYHVVDRRRPADELEAAGFDSDLVRRIVRTVAANEFKRQSPLVAKLSSRTMGVDYLYPRRRPDPGSGS